MNIEAPPKASSLIESMRDVGYSLETALADVVDNSITAGARHISIMVEMDAGSPTIAIKDDGAGMTREELIDAMRLGSKNPLDVRRKNDLGRFGLGLKTASFSQCRRVTVVARSKGKVTAAIWDLDVVASTDIWTLIVPETVPFADEMESDGVLVVWEKLDRAFEGVGTEAGRKHFVHRVDEASRHLELVFHRYLLPESGRQKVEIAVNGLPLMGRDPFNATHPATIVGAKEDVRVGEHIVSITPYTLPHHRNVSQAEWEKYAGPGGYLRSQGFYLYRERRLILHGTWFGLARQSELTKLARVRIDMPNGLDAQWHVDVKKAWARPPLAVRERLQRIIRELGAPSRTVFVRRGQITQDLTVPVWQRTQENNQISYRLNTASAPLEAFRLSLDARQAAEFTRLCSVIGAGLPMDAIYADLAGSPNEVKAEHISDELLGSTVQATVAALLGKRVDPEMVLAMLRVAEPFKSNWDRAEQMATTILNS